jgi:predicted peptidase
MSQTVLNYAIEGGERIACLLHQPGTGTDDTRRRYPLILYLHGAGERGSDPLTLKAYGLTKLLDDKPNFPFIVVSPQCPPDSWWPHSDRLLLALLDHVITHYLADSDRVYLMGSSMGGYGAWELGSMYPDRFAAVVPVCGLSLDPPAQVCSLKDTPVWAFHGLKDVIVPPFHTDIMIHTLQACGGSPKATYVDDAGHELGTTAYQNQELYTWMMEHKLRRRA